MNNLKKGFGLVEALIAASILSIFIASLVIVFQTMIAYSDSTLRQTQASFLAEEGIEALKIMRDQFKWSTGDISSVGQLNTNFEYHLFWDRKSQLLDGTGFVFEYRGTWLATTTPQIIDGIFTRTFVLEEVKRDSNGNISSDGTIDPDTKKLTVTVTWIEKGSNRNLSLSTYITNIYEN